MTEVGRRSHPGPRPPEFDFPFTEAGQAAEACEAAAELLRSLVNEHRFAAEHARVDFQGRTREAFDVAFEQRVGDAERDAAEFAAQASHIHGLIDQARARQQAADAAIARWQIDMVAFETAARAG